MLNPMTPNAPNCTWRVEGEKEIGSFLHSYIHPIIQSYLYIHPIMIIHSAQHYTNTILLCSDPTLSNKSRFETLTTHHYTITSSPSSRSLYVYYLHIILSSST